MARRVKGRSVGGLFRGLSGLGGGARGLVLVLLVGHDEGPVMRPALTARAG